MNFPLDFSWESYRSIDLAIIIGAVRNPRWFTSLHPERAYALTQFLKLMAFYNTTVAIFSMSATT